MNEKMINKYNILNKNYKSYKYEFKKIQKKNTFLLNKNDILEKKINNISDNNLLLKKEKKKNFILISEINSLKEKLTKKNQDYINANNTIMEYKKIGEDFATKKKVLFLQQTIHKFQKENFLLNNNIKSLNKKITQINNNYNNTFNENIKMKDLITNIHSSLVTFLPKCNDNMDVSDNDTKKISMDASSSSNDIDIENISINDIENISESDIFNDIESVESIDIEN